MQNQSRVVKFLAWGVGLFGSEALNPEERLMRFFEEAAELAQAGGMSRRVVDIILDRVYAWPDWNVRREIGQAQACLEMYAHVIGESSDDLAEKEWVRVRTIPREEWERRHEMKTPGQVAYEADCLMQPFYEDTFGGDMKRRKEWDQLGPAAQSSWERVAANRAATAAINSAGREPPR